MTRTPDDDRSDTAKGGTPRPQQEAAERSRAHDPQQQSATRPRPRQSANDREFAPGEDGECH